MIVLAGPPTCPSRAATRSFGASALTNTPFVALFAENGVYVDREWPADGAGEGQMGNVGEECPQGNLTSLSNEEDSDANQSYSRDSR